jgi:hypothetical protein
LLVVPLLASVLVGCALAPVGFFFSTPIGTRLGLEYLGLRAPALFCATWAIHAGTYLGAFAGTAVVCLRIRQLRRESACWPQSYSHTGRRSEDPRVADRGARPGSSA